MTVDASSCSVPAYNMSNSYSPGQAYLYIQTVPASGNDLVSFYIDDFQLTYIPPPTIQTNIPSIFETLSADFPIGAAVDSTDVSGPHEQLLTKHFNSITSENDMKWSSVENTLENYTFGAADTEVGVAVCHDIPVYGDCRSTSRAMCVRRSFEDFRLHAHGSLLVFSARKK